MSEDRWILDYQKKLYAFYGTEVGKLARELENALSESEALEVGMAQGGLPAMATVRRVQARVSKARIAFFNHLGADLPQPPEGREHG